MVGIRWIVMPCARPKFFSSVLAPGERVYMKGLASSNIGEVDCMYMLKCIYGLVQAPYQYGGYQWYSVMKFTRRLVWRNFRLMSACLSAMSLKSLCNNSLPTMTSLSAAHHVFNMDVMPDNVRLQVVLSSGGCYDPRWSYWCMWTTTVYSITVKN